jgi:hypothetical protein
MIKRGKGFDWGACATGCAVWRGVPLHLVLEKAGVVQADGEKPLWLCFEGADMLAKVCQQERCRRGLALSFPAGNLRHLHSVRLGS